MRPHGLGRVSGTGRRKAAPTRRAEERAQRRGNHRAVNSHGSEENMLSRVHLSNPACRSVVIKSRSTPLKSLFVMDARATSTRSSGCVNSC